MNRKLRYNIHTEKHGYGYHDQKSLINTFFGYKDCNTIVIDVRLIYLNDYNCKEAVKKNTSILQLSQSNVLMDENYHYF